MAAPSSWTRSVSVSSNRPLTDTHRWKILAIGVAANASFAAVVGGISATGVLIRSAYGFDTATLGWVLGMLGLGIAISELPWGLMTDRWGDRPVLLTGLVTSSIALACMAAFVVPHAGPHAGVHSWLHPWLNSSSPSASQAAPLSAAPSPTPPAWLLATALCVVGLLGSSVNGSSGRAIMRWFRQQERGLAMSIRQTAVPLGYGLGALILPALATHLGFTYVYGAGALFCLVSAGFAWRWLHEPPDAISTVQGHPSATHPPNAPYATQATSAHATPHRPRDPLKNPQIWRVVSAIGILCAPQFAVLTFGAIFLHDICGLSAATSGIVLAVVQVGAMIVRVWSGRWTDRHRNRRDYLHACCVISGIAFSVLALLAAIGSIHTPSPHAPSTLLVIAILVVSGISVSAWHGVAYAELAEMAGVERAGTALALGNMAAFTLLFVTPSCIPYLLGLRGWSTVWLASVACAAIARMLFPRAARER